jgi:hypothetical protein
MANYEAGLLSGTATRHRFPYSLAAPHIGCEALLSEWERACSSAEGNDLDRFVKHYAAADYLSNYWLGDGVSAAVELVADELAAVSSGLPKWGRTCCSSVHQLVYWKCADWLDHMERMIRRGRKKMPPVNRKTVRPMFIAIANLMRDEFLLSFEKKWEWQCRLFQEISRAYDRRLLTKRSFPGDERRVDPRALNTLSPAERDILEIISTSGHRMVTQQVVSDLEKKNGAASLGTAKTTLAVLVRRKLLTNRTDERGRGYGLAEWE